MAVVPDVQTVPYKAPAMLTHEDTSAAPDIAAIVGSSFSRENDVVNAYHYATRQVNPADPAFTTDVLMSTIQSRGLMDDSQYYAKARSMADFDQISQQIAKERADSVIREKAGWTGFWMDMAAGLISPTTLLPIGEGAKLSSVHRQAGTRRSTEIENESRGRRRS